MRVLIAPDSFKGSLTSVEVARALAAGWLRARPGDDVQLAPLADGGEGTLVAVEASGGWAWREADALDPLGRPIRARWLARDDGAAAFVEMATASGLSLVAPADRDAARATSQGTGEVLRAVLDAGIRDIALGIGGSATTDGGAGLLRALGAPCHATTWRVSTSRAWTSASRRPRSGSRAMSPTRSSASVARPPSMVPRRVLTPHDVPRLDARLARFADALEVATGRRERDTPGAGAAGGVGFGLLCLSDRFMDLRLEPGIDLVMIEAAFDVEARGRRRGDHR